jgi:hypothetical protein
VRTVGGAIQPPFGKFLELAQVITVGFQSIPGKALLHHQVLQK